MKLLKLSEYVYTASFSIVHPSYLEGFPQREKFLFENIPDMEIGWFKHPILNEQAAIDKARQKLRQVYEDNKPDFILFDNPISALILDDELFSKSIFDCCDWYLDYYECEFGKDAGYSRLEDGLEQAIAKTSYCLFQSDTMKEWYLSHSNADVRSHIVLPNGYDEHIFYPGTSSIYFDKTTVLFAGKLGKWYRGLNTVAQALPPDWQLVLVGDGPCREEFESHANVSCMGRVPLPEVGEYMRAANICVLPVNDCSPIATSEYLACRKPVVHQGNRINWMIKDGVNGFVADNTVESWHEKLSAAFQADDLLLENAHSTSYSWTTLQCRLIDWLAEIINK